MTLWEIDVYPVDHEPDRRAEQVAAEAAELGVVGDLPVRTARGYLLEGQLNAEQVARIADELLVDAVVEKAVVAPVGDPQLHRTTNGQAHFNSGSLVHVLPKPGVMDPVAQSAQAAIRDMDLPVTVVRTCANTG